MGYGMVHLTKEQSQLVKPEQIKEEISRLEFIAYKLEDNSWYFSEDMTPRINKIKQQILELKQKVR